MQLSLVERSYLDIQLHMYVGQVRFDVPYHRFLLKEILNFLIPNIALFPERYKKTLYYKR